MLKTTKSWKLTLISFLLAAGVPFVNDALVPYGIIITESEANYFLMMLFGISATGAGVSINKKINERKMKEAETKNIQPVVVQPQQQQQQQQPAHTATAQQVNTASIPASPSPAPANAGGAVDEGPRGNDNIPIPKLGPEGSKYQHNFKSDSSLGNVLDYGQSYLYLRLKGARSYVTAQLKDHAGKLLQIEQAKPGNCTCRLEMFDNVGKPLPRGKYSVTVQGDAGTGDSQGINNDVFHIV